MTTERHRGPHNIIHVTKTPHCSKASQLHKQVSFGQCLDAYKANALFIRKPTCMCCWMHACLQLHPNLYPDPPAAPALCSAASRWWLETGPHSQQQPRDSKYASGCTHPCRHLHRGRRPCRRTRRVCCSRPACRCPRRMTQDPCACMTHSRTVQRNMDGVRT